jgi:serine protease Do
MKCAYLLTVASIGFLMLTLGAAPGALPGQSEAQSAVRPAAQSGSPATPSTPSAADPKCDYLDSSMEQIGSAARTIEQELQAELAGLQKRIDKEVAMSSPELEKLQSLSAKLEGNRDEIEARAERLASRAEEIAERVQESVARIGGQEPTVFVHSRDGESGWLGVEIDEVTAEKAKDLKVSPVRGVLVTDVEPESPAAKAGLKENDVITKYDGQTIEGAMQFRRMVRETPPGRTVTLTISRSGTSRELAVELGDRGAYFEKKMEGKMRDFGRAYAFSSPNFDFHAGSDFGPMDWRTPLLGISAEDLSGQLGAYFGAPDNAGVLVRDVRPATPAEKAGLKAGDVIIKADNKPVRSLEELREQLRDKNEQKVVNLGVLRKGSEMTVAVTIERARPIESSHTVHRAQL